MIAIIFAAKIPKRYCDRWLEVSSEKGEVSEERWIGPLTCHMMESLLRDNIEQ